MMSEPVHDRIQLWVELPAKAEKVWAEIGDFGALAAWHPDVLSSEVVEIEGDIYRHVRLAEGGLLFERLLEAGDHFYTYGIEDSPLPMENARATLSCVAEKEGCRVFWGAVFDPLDPIVDDIVEGFFEVGLEALRKRFGGARRTERRRRNPRG